MRKTFVLFIKFYQSWISPTLGPRCKYYPSCSTYAANAVSEYGAKGLAMAAWRLIRCNPWSHGGVDYVLSKSSKQPIKTGAN
ncbi:MAG: membrane protein insertion efficiency factor YidD [Actinomycetales bacterium]|nr:MAG: membrane protein insertion efficiency factor YidD [Actinomycetales bacterium]